MQITKKEDIRLLFNRIARHYDFVNHFVSLNTDKLWRRKVRKRLAKYNPNNILDVATGTASLAVELLKLNPQKITAIDIAEIMLEEAQKKINKLNKQDVISLQLADCENLPFADNAFDAITVGFGVRNFENYRKGLSEIHRVLRPGGVLLILEFGKPNKFPVKQLYSFYFNTFLPIAGKFLSGSYESYKHLPVSVNTFPYDQNFINILSDIGFKDCHFEKFSMGICYLYQGAK